MKPPSSSARYSREPTVETLENRVNPSTTTTSSSSSSSSGEHALLAINKSRVRIPWGALVARVVRGGQFG